MKIEGQQQNLLHVACQQFMGMPQARIRQVVTETLEGHQRAIMGTMTVEEIYQDRNKFSTAVFQVASKDLISMGITIVNYTIRDVSDEHGYLKALGMSRTAEVNRDARIGEADARKESGIKEAQAKQASESATFANRGEVAKATVRVARGLFGSLCRDGSPFFMSDLVFADFPLRFVIL